MNRPPKGAALSEIRAWDRAQSHDHMARNGLIPGSCEHSWQDGMTATEWHRQYLWDSKTGRRADRQIGR